MYAFNQNSTQHIVQLGNYRNIHEFEYEKYILQRKHKTEEAQNHARDKKFFRHTRTQKKSIPRIFVALLSVK